MLSISWVNRGTTDNFSIFGTNANLARSIVDRAIGDWASVITNFNYTGGGNTFSLNISATTRPAGSRGECTNVVRNNSTQKKPISADISLDDDGGGGGWYFDPTPGNASFPDDVEFDSLLTPFTGDATGKTGNDFYRTIVHEIGHAMGISDDTTGYLKIGDYLSNGGTDPQGGTLRALNFNGGAIDYTLTSMGGGHTWEGGNAPGYTGPSHPNDLMNDGRTINLGLTRREIITDTDAFLLRDVYGYTITTPSTLNTLYVSRNWDTAQIYVRGLNGTSSDTEVINSYQIVGANIFSITVNGYTREMSPSNVNSFIVNGNGGQDFLRLESTLGKAVTLNGGDGDDFFDFGFTSHALGPITGNTYVTGGNGLDQIYVYDNAQTVAQTYQITSSRFDRPGWGGFLYASDIEFENLTTGLAADTVNVQSTFANQPVFLFSAGGADSVFVGNSTNGVQSILSDVNVSNSPSFTTLYINDTGDTTARSANVDFNGSSQFGRINNLAPAHVIWKTSDIQSVNITTGNAADSLLIYSNSETMNINSAGGQDTVQIGDALVGGLQFITGAILVNNSPSFTHLIISDAGGTVARNANMDFAGSSTTGRISNLAPVPITWTNTDIADVSITTGNAADAILVYSNSRPLTLNSSGGNDAITLGAASVGGVQAISGNVTVTNSPSFSTLTITDDGDTVARTATIDVAGNVESITGLTGGVLSWNVNDTLSPVSITTGNGADTINVSRTTTNLALASIGGADTVNIGNSANGCNGIGGNISINNTPSFTTLTFNDLANPNGRTWTVSSDGATGTTRLSASAAVSYRLLDIQSPMTLNLSNAADDVKITGTDTRTMNINGNGGNDLFEFGSPGNLVDPINAAVSVDGGGNTDTITFNNSADTTEAGFNVTANTISESKMASVTFTNAEALEFRGGSGASPTHTFLNTPANVALKLFPGASHDLIKVTNNGDWLTIKPSSGSDDVSVNDGASTSGAKVKFDASIILGNLTIKNLGNASAVGTNMLVKTNVLSIPGNAVLDLFSNDFIATATARSTIEGYVRSAYNGGNWNGPGIYSTTAKLNPSANTTLGVLGGTDFNAVNGGTFNGQTVNSSDVLVKYTYFGDVDFNGKVNFDDYTRVDLGFNGGRTGWVNGDFNYNGKVNFDDYALIDLAFGTQGAAL